MSTHTYVRKLLNGQLASPSKGNPSLVSEVESAFPGFKWLIRADETNVNVIFTEVALDAGQQATLQTAYDNWTPFDPGYTFSTSLVEPDIAETNDKNSKDVTSMEIRPGKGAWTVTMSSTIEKTDRRGKGTIALYRNGSKVNGSERKLEGTFRRGDLMPIVLEAVFDDLTDDDLITVQWSISKGTLKLYERTLNAKPR